jgi:hypothetical protein
MATSDTVPQVIRGSDDDLRSWIADYDAAPAARIDRPSTRSDGASTGSKSVLDLIPYVAVDRSQGAAANCWVWSGTGILEAAHATGTGVRDRLSIQYFDSNYNGGTGPAWAGNGGSLGEFVRFYTTQRIAVPWSNANASYQDGRDWCRDNGQAWIPAGSVGTDPHYDILSITAERVETRGISDAAARANIKALLDSNRPAYLAVRLPDCEAWNAFYTFWNTAPETAVFDLSTYNGRAWTTGGGGHAALVVGYDETDPSNPYWLVLNSWGTANGKRPQGTFRLSMNLSYDGSYQGSFQIPSTEWQTLAVRYAEAPSPMPTTVAPTPTPTTTERLTATFTFPRSPALVDQPVQFTDASSGAPTGHSWDFGDGTSSTLMSPSHAYIQAGTFKVTHSVTKDGRRSSATKTITVFGGDSSAAISEKTGPVSRNARFDIADGSLPLSPA